LREHGLVGDRDLEGGHEGETADGSLGRRRSRGQTVGGVQPAESWVKLVLDLPIGSI
jgi:hypothetical protein